MMQGPLPAVLLPARLGKWNGLVALRRVAVCIFALPEEVELFPDIV